ncbi:MAG: hypothetical protein Q8O83_01010 [bacterium]|nr:hypothetical protein [bacterium]
MNKSIQRELERLEDIGAIIKIDGNTITIYRGVVPQDIVEAFKNRIKSHDTKNDIEVIIK